MSKDILVAAEPPVTERYAGLMARLPELERELQATELKVHALRQLIDGIRAVNGQPVYREFQGQTYVVTKPSMNGKTPKGGGAILKVMAERPEHIWKLVQIKREMLGRGWAPSPKSVDANIKRLLVFGRVENPSYGYYRLPERDVAALARGTQAAPQPPKSLSGEVDEA